MQQVKFIRIHWSENSELNRMYGAKQGTIEKDVTLNAFTIKCKAASLSAPLHGNGYDKTKFTAHFEDNTQFTFRLDMTQRDYNPKTEIQEYLNWKASKTVDNQL